MKEIINETEETLEITNEIIQDAAYDLTKKLNGKPKTYMSKTTHKQPLEIKDRTGNKHYKRRSIYD